MKRGVLLALALGAVACATPGAPPDSSPPLAVPGAEARAEAEAQRAREPEPPPELAFLLAQELEQAGKLEEAYARYERILASDPDDAFLLTRLAQLGGHPGGQPPGAAGDPTGIYDLRPQMARNRYDPRFRLMFASRVC